MPEASQSPQPLAACIIEIVNTANGLIPPVEIRKKLSHMGRMTSKAAVSSTLSTLVRRHRLARPEPGLYGPILVREKHPSQFIPIESPLEISRGKEQQEEMPDMFPGEKRGESNDM